MKAEGTFLAAFRRGEVPNGRGYTIDICSEGGNQLFLLKKGIHSKEWQNSAEGIAASNKGNKTFTKVLHAVKC